MTEISRVGSGVPTGGQFAAHDRQESEAALPSPIAIEIPASTISLPAHNNVLPPYPEQLGTPAVQFGFGDDHPGTLYGYFEVADTHVTVWVDEYGDRGNSISDGSEETGWDPEDDEQFVEWAHAVTARAAQDAQLIIGASFVTAVERALVENATR